jgi:hypothetical protein
MTRPNWRDPGAYRGIIPLDAPGFAWEFLKRNPAFIDELRFLRRVQRHRSLTRVELELFAWRWGVRFCWAARNRRGSGRDLDVGGTPQHDDHRVRCCGPG